MGLSHNPRDVNGTPVATGDTVRLVEYGKKALCRRVEAVATKDEPHLAGCIVVQGLLGWRSARQFEKVQR